jgi:hypothetical protein
VLATLADASAVTLYAFTVGLQHVDGPASRFHLAIFYLASGSPARRRMGSPSS